MQDLKELEEKSSGHYYNQASIVQYWCRDHNSEQLIHHRKSSTDQEHICYILIRVGEKETRTEGRGNLRSWSDLADRLRAQLFFKTGAPELVVQKLELLPLDVRCCNNKEAPNRSSNATASEIKSDERINQQERKGKI